jgi:hypothetical protein
LRLLRASSVESRFEAMHPGGMTALVGREEELELLLRRRLGAWSISRYFTRPARCGLPKPFTAQR